MNDDYTALNYDKSLNKITDQFQVIPAVDFEQQVDNISANKITQGVSQGSKLGIDYDNGIVEVNEGNTVRIVTGKFLDGKFGMRVYSASGNVVVDSTA